MKHPFALLSVHFVAFAFAALAAEVEPVWLSEQPVPKAAELSELKGVEFHVIKANEPERDAYVWLHGVALCKLYVGFSNSGGRRGNHNGAELAVIPIPELRAE